MKLKLRGLVLILGIIFLFYFSINLSFGATLIEDDGNSLIPLTYTKYFNNKPLLIFVNQQNKKTVRILDDVNNFVFKDTNWHDLAIDLVTEHIEFSSHPRFNINKAGTYELYLDLEIENLKPKNLEPDDAKNDVITFELEIDGKEVFYYAVDLQSKESKKYIKLCDFEIGEDNHIVKVKDIGTIKKINLVNLNEKIKAEKIIWQKINNPNKEVSYILSDEQNFYVP